MTDMVVSGEYSELLDLKQKLENAIKIARENKWWDLYTIYEQYGYKKDEILNDGNLGYIRGTIIDVMWNDDDKDALYITYESAWGPMIEGFDYILRKHYKTLTQVSLSEEMGMEIYINTDVEGTYFSQKWCIDIVDNDIVYCDSDDEAVKVLNNLGEKTGMKFETIKQWERNLEMLNNHIDEFDVYLHEFGPY